MAFTATQKRENTSTWLQYHLGQSTGYRDLSRRLQKRFSDPVPVQPNYHVIAEYQSLAPLSPRGDRRSRVPSGGHVISSGDFFWLHRDKLDSFGVTSAQFNRSRDNANAKGDVSGLRLRGVNPFTSVSRGCRSAGSRLLGTTRSEPNCASATRRNIRVNRKCDTDGNMAAGLMLLDPSKETPIGLGKVSYDSPRDAASTHNYITSAKHGQHNVIVNYHIGASPITRSRSEFFTGTIVPRQVNTLDNHAQTDAGPSAPIQPNTDHVIQHQPIADEIKSAEIETNQTSDVTSSSPEQLNPEKPEEHDPEQTATSGEHRKSISDLTISDFFYVTLGDDAADDENSPHNGDTDDVISSAEPVSELIRRPSTKRSVRFSVENDVYRYSPWEPISCS